MKTRRIARHGKQPVAHPVGVAQGLGRGFADQTVSGRVLQTPIKDGSFTDPNPDNDGNAGYGAVMGME